MDFDHANNELLSWILVMHTLSGSQNTPSIFTRSMDLHHSQHTSSAIMGLNPILEFQWKQCLIHGFQWKHGLFLGLREYNVTIRLWGDCLILAKYLYYSWECNCTLAS